MSNDQRSITSAIESGESVTADTPSISPHTEEKNLWMAVITQAFLDATSTSEDRTDRLNKARALAWLSSGSHDFYTVCTLADICPYYVREKTKSILRDADIWRAQLATMRRIETRQHELPVQPNCKTARIHRSADLMATPIAC